MDCYSKNNGSIGYSYADWGGNITGLKSTTGYLFQVSGIPIPWQTKKQPALPRLQLKWNMWHWWQLHKKQFG